MAGNSAAVTSAEDLHRHDQNQYLTFMLGGEVFAVGILPIKEIVEYEQPTDVPMMPSFIRGVINLRGAVVPVVDLARRFGRASAPVTKKTCIVIVETMVEAERHIIGIVVDAVNEVLEIPHGEIEPPPAFGTSVRTDFIEGMGKVKGRFVIILKVDRVLSVEEMESLARVASGPNTSAAAAREAPAAQT